MINKRLDEIEENIKEINEMIKDDNYFKLLEKSIECVNNQLDKKDKMIKELLKENKKYKEVLYKIKEIILNHKDYETEGLLVEETSNILELLEEIE